MRALIAILLILSSPLSCALASEGELSASVPSHRATRKLGILAALNDPVPAVWGVSIGWNVTELLRLTAGTGGFSSDYDMGGFVLKTRSVTYGAGARLMVPGWNLTPIVGLGWATISTEGFTDDSNHFYATAGVEWQTSLGLTLGAGYDQSFDSKIGGLPYLNVGWFFPI